MRFTLIPVVTMMVAGCGHPPEITSFPASPFNRCEPPGMPFYLPKPLLVVAKNVRHIDEAKTGLTQPAVIPNAFDNQASFADIKANVTVPGSGDQVASLPAAADTGKDTLPSKFDDSAPQALPEGWRGAMTPEGRVQDGLAPDSFYTYQIMFVPDLGQKYGLSIKGKPGEVRAAMNLVNGWMYTGMGPYYMKNSSTAQNTIAAGAAAMFVGRGVADALNSIAGLATTRGGPGGSGERARTNIDSDDFVDRVAALANIIHSQTRVPQQMLNYAEISIYQPTLNELGGMDWELIAYHQFDRHYFTPDMDANSKNMLMEMIRSVAGPASGMGGSQTSVPTEDTEDDSTGTSSSSGEKPLPSRESRSQTTPDNLELVPADSNNSASEEFPAPSAIPANPTSSRRSLREEATTRSNQNGSAAPPIRFAPATLQP